MSVDIDKVAELAKSASAMDLSTAEKVTDCSADEQWECPLCNGDGYVNAGIDYCNIDAVAVGVQFYGIGKHHGADEEYFRSVSPSAILELIDRIKSAESERDALREEMRKASEQDPRGYELVTSNSIEYFSLFSDVCEAAQGGGDVVPLYASPVPTQKDYKIEDNHILFLAEKFMPSAFLSAENKQILWFAKACIDADQPISQPLIYDEPEPKP
jgi:hypothetical protein